MEILVAFFDEVKTTYAGLFVPPRRSTALRQPLPAHCRFFRQPMKVRVWWIIYKRDMAILRDTVWHVDYFNLFTAYMHCFIDTDMTLLLLTMAAFTFAEVGRYLPESAVCT